MISTRTVCMLLGCLGAVSGLAWTQQPALLGSPSRSFSTGQRLTSEAYMPNGQALADLDHDGDLDLVHAHTGNWIDPRFSVLLNRGDGTYAPPTSVRTAGETAEVVAAHLDADAHIDVALTQSAYGSGGSSVLVFRGKGDGSFHPQQIWSCGAGPIGLAAADFDRDGDVDLVSANWGWNEGDVSVLYNNGAAGFSQRTDFPVVGGAGGPPQPYQVAAGDLNGDSWPDLAVTIRGGHPAVQLLFNNGAGGFGAPVPYDAGQYNVEVPGVQLANVDGDGDLDVLAAEALFRNNGNGTLAAPQAWSWNNLFGAMHSFTVADFTGDGHADVGATAHSSDYGWFLAVNNGSGSFPAHEVFATGASARSIDAGDLDADGDVDVAVANAGSLNVTVHNNDGAGFSLPAVTVVPPFSRRSDAGDLDGDGDIDLVTVTSAVHVLANDGSGSFAVSSWQPGLGALAHPRLADLDGDLDLDLMLLKDDTAPPYNLHVAFNQGNATFGGLVTVFLGSCGTGGVEALDLDLDGDRDIVVTEYLGCPGQDGRKLYLVKNNGNGSFQPALIVPDFTITALEGVLAGDLDNDGDDDLMTGSVGLVTWLSNGSGGLSAPILSDTGGNPVKFMASGDLDGDGNLDVAIAGWGDTWQGDELTVLLGYGDGGFRPPQTYYGMFGGAGGLEALDLDLDGDLDLVAGCAASSVALWLNAGDGTFLPEQRYGVAGGVGWIQSADFNADGIPDVAASIGTGPPLGSGIALLEGLPAPAVPQLYCTAKTTSNGCVPSLGWTGTPQPGGAFTVLVAALEPGQLGTLFYSTTGDNAGGSPFQGGFLCVSPPVTRVGVHSTGGSSPCSGAYAVPLEFLVSSLPAGTDVYAQAWFRDPGAGTGTGLTGGLAFTLAP